MPKIKVLDTFAIPVFAYDILKELGTVSLFTDIPSDADTTLKRAQGADVIVLNKTQLTADIIHSLQDVKLIAETASGYDNIDVEAAASRGIPVCNAPGYSTQSVAEHVFALILCLCRKILPCNEQVSRGEWLDEPLMGEDLAGKTLGIIGFGKIGRAVHAIAQGFGLKVLVHTRSADACKDVLTDDKLV